MLSDFLLSRSSDLLLFSHFINKFCTPSKFLRDCLVEMHLHALFYNHHRQQIFELHLPTLQNTLQLRQGILKLVLHQLVTSRVSRGHDTLMSLLSITRHLLFPHRLNDRRMLLHLFPQCTYRLMRLLVRSDVLNHSHHHVVLIVFVVHLSLHFRHRRKVLCEPPCLLETAQRLLNPRSILFPLHSLLPFKLPFSIFYEHAGKTRLFHPRFPLPVPGLDLPSRELHLYPPRFSLFCPLVLWDKLQLQILAIPVQLPDLLPPAPLLFFLQAFLQALLLLTTH